MQRLKMNNISFSKVERVLLKVGRAINSVADVEKLLTKNKLKRNFNYRQRVKAKKSAEHLLAAKKELLIAMEQFGRKKKESEKPQGELF